MNMNFMNTVIVDEVPDEGLITGAEILPEFGFCSNLLLFYVPSLLLSSDF